MYTFTIRKGKQIVGTFVQGDGQEALVYFEQMQRHGVLHDVFTFLSILKACGSIRSLDKGKKIHGKINVVTYS